MPFVFGLEREYVYPSRECCVNCGLRVRTRHHTIAGAELLLVVYLSSSWVSLASTWEDVLCASGRSLRVRRVEPAPTWLVNSRFLSLSCPRLFIYGERNSSLSYLQALAAGGIELAAIPHSAHFPMYSNPVAMWERIGEFYTRNNLT